MVGIGAPLTQKLIFDYDLAGRLTAVRTASGERIDYVMNAMGGVTSQTTKRADGSVRDTVTRTFDELNRMLTLTLGPGRTSSYQYDKGGNVTKVTSARSNATNFAFGALNRLKTTVLPAAATTGEGYDVRDNLTSHADALNLTTAYVRNGFGDVIQETSPDRGKSVFYYDVAGDMTASIDGRNQRVNYTRDVLGRVTKKAPVGVTGQDITYTWDTGGMTSSYPKGRLGKIVDASGTTSYQWDHRGNMLARAQKIGSTAAATLYHAYDLADRVIRMQYPSGRGAQYTRDTKGRVIKVETRATGTAAWVTLASTIEYEAFGPMKSAAYGNGLTLTQDWGSDGRLYARALKRSNGTNVWAASYAYDNDDNITGITDLLDAAKSVTYAYDARDRLVRADTPTGAIRRTDYVFDANGNRTRVEARADPAQASPTSAVDYARVANSSRLASVDTGAAQRGIAYDGRGDTASETRPAGVSVTTAYDAYGRLTGYTRTGDPTQANVYNGLDDRVQVTSGSAVRRYLYDADGRLLGDYGTSATDVKGEYVWLTPDAANDNQPFGGDDGNSGWMPLAVATGPQASVVLHWLTGDQLGKPILTTDVAGNAVTTATSYAGLQYPGQIATLPDLVYNRYRDYDPTTGRYIHADPIGLDGGENAYLYAQGNPLVETDVWGLQPSMPRLPRTGRRGTRGLGTISETL